METKKDAGLRDLMSMSITDSVIKFSTKVGPLFSREGLSYVKKETLEFKSIEDAWIYYNSISEELNPTKPRHGMGTTEQFTKAITEGFKSKEEIDDVVFYEWRDEHFRRFMWQNKFEHKGIIKGRFTIEQLKQLWQADPEMEAVRDYSDHHPDVDFAKTMDKIEDDFVKFDRSVGNYTDLTPKPFQISEEDFYNKEKCDILRALVVESPINLDDATKLLKGSNDFARDALVIKKLALVGFEIIRINQVIKALNQ
jgi:hypothetical protein